MAKHSVHGQSDDTGVGRTGDAADAATRRTISRRTLAKGAAWSVPAIMLATAAPAYAGSHPSTVDLGDLLESSADISGHNQQGMVSLAAMYFRKDKWPEWVTKSLHFDVTVTIEYTRETDFSFNYGTGPVFSGDWKLDDESTNTKLIFSNIDKMRTSADSGIGTNLTLTWDSGWDGGAQKYVNSVEKGSILVTAEATATADDGTILEFHSLYMGNKATGDDKWTVVMTNGEKQAVVGPGNPPQQSN